VSFKRGEGQREHSGRHFTDATEAQLESWAGALPQFEKMAIWQTADRRPGRDECWLNGVFHKCAEKPAKLITGGRHQHFFPHLCASINKASEIDMAVAFVKATGLKLFWPTTAQSVMVANSGTEVDHTCSEWPAPQAV